MKKIISLLMILILSISYTAYGTSYEGRINDFDLAELKKFHILEGDADGNLRLEDDISRGEVAKMLCVMMGIDENEETTTTFPDVPQNCWYYKYANILKSKGVLNGDEKGNFNGDNKVSHNEIVKMLICSVGLGEIAEEFLGYPKGYNEYALMYGIYWDDLKNMNSNASRNDVAQMFANTLDIPHFETYYSEFDQKVKRICYDGTGIYELRTHRVFLENK